ncbi:MAG: HNH endonuclease signature motif containing protein [Anaerolineaceae bacterium]|nr:HNH endonuclease signature motif containing protein [Anaerolineaceae bacterium]
MRNPRRRVRRISIGTILFLIVLAAAYYMRGTVLVNNPGFTIAPATGNPTPTVSLEVPQWGRQIKKSGCQVNGPLQDQACTPGDIFPDVTKADICKSGYASSVRNVPSSVKDRVYVEYGIPSHSPGEYEVDHLVSLELGGSNDISNLWPEAASPQPGFHEKDKVENYLHDQVCSGAINLMDAQIQIATNWLAIYQQMPNP